MHVGCLVDAFGPSQMRLIFVLPDRGQLTSSDVIPSSMRDSSETATEAITVQ